MTRDRDGNTRTLVEDHRWLLRLFGNSHPLLVLLFAVPLAAFLLGVGLARSAGALSSAGHLALGVLYWTFVEYAMHRWVYHWRPRNVTLRRIVQSFHIAHHRDIDDRAFWNAGPMLALPLAGILAVPLAIVLRDTGAVAMTLAGALGGYYVYEWFHFKIHERPSGGGWLGYMRRFHLQHHHGDPHARFGVSNPLWDMVFGTHVARPRPVRRASPSASPSAPPLASPKRRTLASPAAAAAMALALSLALALVAAGEEPAPALLGAEVWTGLQAPSGSALASLAGRVPDLDRARVREVPLELARSLMARAAERRLSSLDVFTDPGLTRADVYYLPREVLAEVHRSYDLGSLFPIAGETTDGVPFAMEAILMGGGRIDMLFSLDDFTFKHPVYRSYGGRYTLRSRVSQRILGAGVISIEGVLGPLNATIRRFTKLSATTVHVETSLLDQEEALQPIRRRDEGRAGR